MNFLCESRAKYFLPTFRAMIAKELIREYEFSQVKAAQTLGITQAAISQYLSQKRGTSSINKIVNSVFLQNEANKIAEEIAKGNVIRDDIQEKVCEICHLFSKE